MAFYRNFQRLFPGKSRGRCGAAGSVARVIQFKSNHLLDLCLRTSPGSRGRAQEHPRTQPTTTGTCRGENGGRGEGQGSSRAGGLIPTCPNEDAPLPNPCGVSEGWVTGSRGTASYFYFPLGNG